MVHMVKGRQSVSRCLNRAIADMGVRTCLRNLLFCGYEVIVTWCVARCMCAMPMPRPTRCSEAVWRCRVRRL